MKKILAVAIVLFSIGCSNIKFDALNYDRTLSVYEMTKLMSTQCDKPDLIKDQLPDLQQLTSHMELYSKLRTGSPEVASSMLTMSSMVNELSSRYSDGEPSVGYCIEKLKLIADTTYTIASALGAQQ